VSLLASSFAIATLVMPSPARAAPPDGPEGSPTDVSAPTAASEAASDPQPTTSSTPPSYVEVGHDADARTKPFDPLDGMPEGTRIAEEKPGPPFATPEERERLRASFGLGPLSAQGPEPTRVKRTFGCLVADPSCRVAYELTATSSYSFRIRQTEIDDNLLVQRWSSGRVDWQFAPHFAVASDVVGRRRYARVTLGPRIGVTASDRSDLWGNVGIASRIWFGRGSWAPHLDLGGGMSFWLRGVRGNELKPLRSPAGVSLDVGFGFGGWGSIVVGGQLDTPLVREELPPVVRINPSGMVFIGFRGNLAWGAPAALGVATHAVTQRFVERP